MISEKELNSYRLTSMEEPTDEMLAVLYVKKLSPLGWLN